ncbi:Fe(3+) ABC transporter substrate-binding protein [Aquisalimonas asiatica]|uniref:Iron(III) transport system substrate-binding protein n=1 Tax=Aquisalimonas asiatica TaxID=406100 RepID=A0A1H8VJH0_9GAMM|nr:Fe(3+) ABC transporter substrate-binding protein [Aquisalimonas asiatica]SEP15576.1 iron(III) transport system substrate-binding protein [Aquisalimonas asiatica]
MTSPLLRRAVTGALAAAITVAPLTALAGEVTVYSARHYDEDRTLYDTFTERTGIEVRVLEADSDQLIQRIRREGAASPADVLITVDAGRLWRAEQEGVFQAVESEALTERLPEAMRHPEGLWFGFSQRMRVVFYNKDAFDPDELETYEDLADPRFNDQLCIRSSGNIYNQSLLAAMIAVHGEEDAEAWAQGVVDNLARPPRGGDTDQIRGVATGECEIGVANHYYYVRMVNSDDSRDRELAERVGIIFPNQNDRGVHVNVGGAGVVDGAPNRENAIRFLEYLASDEAQGLFAAGNHELPVVDGVSGDEVVESWGSIKRDALNISELGNNNPAAVRMFDRVGWR